MGKYSHHHENFEVCYDPETPMDLKTKKLLRQASDLKAYRQVQLAHGLLNEVRKKLKDRVDADEASESESFSLEGTGKMCKSLEHYYEFFADLPY